MATTPTKWFFILHHTTATTHQHTSPSQPMCWSVGVCVPLWYPDTFVCACGDHQYKLVCWTLLSYTITSLRKLLPMLPHALSQCKYSVQSSKSHASFGFFTRLRILWTHTGHSSSGTMVGRCPIWCEPILFIIQLNSHKRGEAEETKQKRSNGHQTIKKIAHVRIVFPPFPFWCTQAHIRRFFVERPTTTKLDRITSTQGEGRKNSSTNIAITWCGVMGEKQLREKTTISDRFESWWWW